MDDQQIMQAYQVLSSLISLASIVLYVVGTVMVFSTRHASPGKHLIGFGLVIHAVFGVAGLAMQFGQRMNLGLGNAAIMGFFALLHLASVTATAMIIFGAVQLLRRNSLLELIQQDDVDDDR